MKTAIALVLFCIMMAVPFQSIAAGPPIDPLTESHSVGRVPQLGQFIEYWDEKLVVPGFGYHINGFKLIPQKPEAIICVGDSTDLRIKPYIAVFNTISWEETARFPDGTSCAFDVASDGSFILEHTGGGEYNVFRTTDYTSIGSFDFSPEGSGYPDGVHISHDNERIYFMENSLNVVQEWSVETWEMTTEVTIEKLEDSIFAWSSDDAYYAVEVYCGYKVFRASDHTLIKSVQLDYDDPDVWFDSCDDEVRLLRFVFDDQYLLRLGNDGLFQLLNTGTWDTGFWDLHGLEGETDCGWIFLGDCYTVDGIGTDALYFRFEGNSSRSAHLLIVEPYSDYLKSDNLTTVPNDDVTRVEVADRTGYASYYWYRSGDTLYTYSFDRLYRWSLKTGWDLDYDQIVNDEDNCVDLSNPDQSDYDSDGLGNACDSDDDGDGVEDFDDNCPLGIRNWLSNSRDDYDSDGCLDSTEDTDDDADSVPDVEDECPYNENYSIEPDAGCIDKRTTVDSEEPPDDGPADLPTETEQAVDTAGSYVQGGLGYVLGAVGVLNVLLIMVNVLWMVSNRRSGKEQDGLQADSEHSLEEETEFSADIDTVGEPDHGEESDVFITSESSVALSQEQSISRQEWTDEQGQAWRRSSDGRTEWWNGLDWQEYQDN